MPGPITGSYDLSADAVCALSFPTRSTDSRPMARRGPGELHMDSDSEEEREGVMEEEEEEEVGPPPRRRPSHSLRRRLKLLEARAHHRMEAGHADSIQRCEAGCMRQLGSLKLACSALLCWCRSQCWQYGHGRAGPPTACRCTSSCASSRGTAA